MTLYFEDFEAGTVRDLGEFSLSEAEIVGYAQRYDPQPIHTDPDAAAESEKLPSSRTVPSSKSSRYSVIGRGAPARRSSVGSPSSRR